ncbi:MAG: helix-turn-helix transcriptional regulator [Clostridium sp.]|nr:helix-turn-helix transcriptional regulator [Clostridium sp.]
MSLTCETEVGNVAISYNRLWKLLIDKSIKKTDLRSIAGISTHVIAKLGKNDYVSMETLTKICPALHCDIADIVEMSAEAGEEVRNDFPKRN